jgi:glycosyltransferase involved in cell wall biosynthesis
VNDGRRHVLVVAWWFPPLSGGGVHRPLHFVRHLDRRGFRVTVLTGRPARGERLDEGLLAKVPPSVRVVRVGRFDPFLMWEWIKRGRAGSGDVASSPAATPGSTAPRVRLRDLVTEAIALPDRFVPWIVPAVTRAALALRGDEPQLVFSTAPPHSVHLVARLLAGLFAAPLVLDFRDPWAGNPFRRHVAPFFARLDAALERSVVASAAQVVLNTAALERQFRARYPGFPRVRTIPNGFDPDAFASLPPPTGGGTPGLVEVAHFGQLYGLRSGRWLLHALAALKQERPEVAARVKVVLVGSIDGEAEFRAQTRQLGVADLVAIEPALPHARALARQRTSDVLLLLGPENREPEVQVPGKLYEYFAAQRPILALARRGGAIEETLRAARVPFERAEPDAPAEIADALARLVESSRVSPVEASPRDGTDAFRYDRLGDRLVETFEDAWRAIGAMRSDRGRDDALAAARRG